MRVPGGRKWMVLLVVVVGMVRPPGGTTRGRMPGTEGRMRRLSFTTASCFIHCQSFSLSYLFFLVRFTGVAYQVRQLIQHPPIKTRRINPPRPPLEIIQFTAQIGLNVFRLERVEYRSG